MGVATTEKSVLNQKSTLKDRLSKKRGEGRPEGRQVD